MNNSELSQIASRAQREILESLKSTGPATIAELAQKLEVTDEAARRHVLNLESLGWISGQTDRSQAGRAGRPVTIYRLTDAGDHLFPKRYDDLTLALLNAVASVHGEGALKKTLAAIVEMQVSGWEERMAGKTLEERVEILRGYYLEEDPYTSVEESDGNPVLIERNCPFQNVAGSEPRLCSTTVSTLSRLLGFQIVRKLRIQNGDGRCAFHVLRDKPIDAAQFQFDFEPDLPPESNPSVENVREVES